MSQSEEPIFPQEILDHIVDHIHNDVDTLKACSLASQCLVPRTRQHLFRSVKIDLGASLDTGKSLYTFMQMTAEPSPFREAFHILHLMVPKPQAKGEEELPRHRTDPTRCPINIFTILVQLGQLPNIENLILDHICIERLSQSEVHREAHYRKMRLRQLFMQQIVCEEPMFPQTLYQLLYPFYAIDTLEIGPMLALDMEFYEVREAWHRPLPPPHLQTKAVTIHRQGHDEDWQALLANIVTTVMLPNQDSFHTLRIRVDHDNDFAAFEELVEHCGRDLRVLTLDVANGLNGSRYTMPHPPKLHLMPNLKRVHAMGFPEPGFFQIIDALPTTVTRFDVTVVGFGGPEMPLKFFLDRFTQSDQWSRMDESLANLSHLKIVRFDFINPNYLSRKLTREEKDKLATLMPRLGERGILGIQTCVRDPLKR